MAKKQRLDRIIQVRISEPEYKLIQDLMDGRTISEFLRDALAVYVRNAILEKETELKAQHERFIDWARGK